MIVQQENWAGIPVLHTYAENMKDDAPIVIFLHGFTSAKEHNLHYAFNLVNQGVRVVLPDADLHGDRAKDYSEMQLANSFWEIVLKSTKEVAQLHEQLKKRGFTGKVGLAGTSMGGIVTSGCLRQYDFIEAAGILMGTMSYTELAMHQLQQFEQQGIDLGLSEEEKQKILHILEVYNLKDQPGVLERVPTYIWHGANDAVVPFSMTYPFYEQLVATNNIGAIHYVVDKKAGHAVSRAGMLEMCRFIAQRLE